MASDTHEQHLGHLLRMEKLTAQLRLAAVLLTGAVLLNTAQAEAFAWGGGPMAAAWLGALAYAAAVLFAAPYRRLPPVAWGVLSGLVDWTLITVAIVATGAARSDLYVLYFLSVLSIALRFGLREVVVAGLGTVAGYLGMVMVTTLDWPAALHTAGTRMGYVLLFALGSGLLAREARRQLRARVTGEAQRRAVQEVAATVSHDLRNPLAAITGLVEILLDAAPRTLSSDQRSLLHRISANAQQMTNLVGNLVDAELIERGQQAFRPAPVNLNTLVRHIVEAHAHHAEVKHIGLVLDLAPQRPYASVDSGMVERLLANLLDNAVKFTPEHGAIRVSSRRRGARIEIEVWNSGPHLPPALQATLFQKFVRAEDSRGVGLGLYICKSIAARHGGAITVHNVDDGGVAVVAEFPAMAGARADQPTAAPAWQLPRRALG